MHELRTGDTNAEKEQVVRWKPLDDFNTILSTGTFPFKIYTGNSLVCGLGKCPIDVYYRTAHGLY